MSEPAPPPRLVITIDRLVLRGFPAGARAAVVQAFAAELRRLAAKPGVSFGASRAAGRLGLAPLQLGAGAAPETTAVAAARRLIEGLRR